MLVVHWVSCFWKYGKANNWLSCRHTEGSAFSSATSPSRQWSALRSKWRGVLICWHMDMQVSRAGLWLKSYGYWMGSVWGDKAQERERVHPVMSVTKLSNICKCLASTKFGSTVVAVCLPARVVARSSAPTTAPTDTISLCVTSLTTGRVFAIYPCGAKTTIKTTVWLQHTVRSSCWSSMFNGIWPKPTNKRFNSAYLQIKYLFFLEKFTVIHFD